MAYLDKDEYARRERNAQNRMKRNAEIDSLSEEQHDVLSWLCSIRHKLHNNSTAEILYNTNASDFQEYWNLFDTENTDNTIIAKLKSVGLPKWSWQCDWNRYANDSEADLDDEGEEIEDWDLRDEAVKEHYDLWIDKLSDLSAEWNESIEDYLIGIDEEFGTNYAPSGYLRRF